MEEQKTTFCEISIEDLTPWENAQGIQPFKPYQADALLELAKSIRTNGVITPITVRPQPDGKYQIIAGHNRAAASRMIGNTTVPAFIKDLSDDDAVLCMLDSNLQTRKNLAPSEKAKAYKLRLDTVQKLRKMTENGDIKRSRAIVADDMHTSSTQVQRYIRLTELDEQWLELVDQDKLKIRPAVELSYLTKEEQKELLANINEYELKLPNVVQATNLRNLSAIGKLDQETILAVMQTEEKKQETVKIPWGRISGFFRSGATEEDIESRIVAALGAYESFAKEETH